MTSLLRPFLRDLQSRFGPLLGLKSRLQRRWRNLRKTPFEYEYSSLEFIEPNEFGGQDFIDIGANRGQSIDAIRLYHPTAQIYSFEPNAVLYNKLRTLFTADKNIRLYNYGLGESDASHTLYVPFYRQFMYDGLASFSKDRAAGWLNASSVWRFKPHLLRIEEHICQIKRLDDFLLKPTVVKIHVQGHELEVLRGAEETLESYKPLLLLANNVKADSWLREKNWQQYSFQSGQLRPMPQNNVDLYNVLYLHPDNKSHNKLIERLS